MKEQSKNEFIFSAKSNDTEYYYSCLRSRFEKLDKLINQDIRATNEIKSVFIDIPFKSPPIG